MAALQGIPLLGAAGCFANAASDQNSGLLAMVLWLSILCWGAGYFYLERYVRFGLSFIFGPVLASSACRVAFSTSDYYDSFDSLPSEVASANEAAILTGVIVSLISLAMIADALYLASEHNHDIEPPPRNNASFR